MWFGIILAAELTAESILAMAHEFGLFGKLKRKIKGKWRKRTTRNAKPLL